LWHPADPSGSVEHYAAWVETLAARYRGQIDHYIIGDEENRAFAPTGFDGSAEAYLKRMFIPLAEAIRKGDPEAKISTCGVSSAPDTKWLLELIKLGLPKYGDGVGCNLWHGVVEDTWQVTQFMAAVRKVWPQARFYSSGVGYVINRGEHDRHQAAIAAQTMFTLWDIGWDSAAYYLYRFSITADTKQNYGLIDFDGGEGKYLYTDAWKAYQTIAHTFYNREEFVPPAFAVNCSGSPTLFRTYEHRLNNGSELLIILWNEGAEAEVEVSVGNSRYQYPVRISLFDADKWADVPFTPDNSGGKLRVVVGSEPVIIRMFGKE